jgi:hypothetical protein
MPAPCTCASSIKPVKHGCTGTCQPPQRPSSRRSRPPASRSSWRPHAGVPGTGWPPSVLTMVSLVCVGMPSPCRPSMHHVSDAPPLPHGGARPRGARSHAGLTGRPRLDQTATVGNGSWGLLLPRASTRTGARGPVHPAWAEDGTRAPSGFEGAEDRLRGVCTRQARGARTSSSVWGSPGGAPA